MESGVQFVNGQNNCPLCAPSRASLWSGLYPHTSGYFGYNQQANHWRRSPVLRNTVTLPEHFRANGYQVAATGKIHHNGHEDYSIFSEFGPKPSHGPWPWDGKSVNERGGKERCCHPSMPPPLNTSHWEDSFGPLTEVPKYPGHEGWVLYNEPYRYASDADHDPTPDELSAAWAVQKLRKGFEQPFLLMVGFNRPHTPLYAPKKYFDMFPAEEMELPPYLENDLEDCARMLREQPASGYGFGRFQRLLEAGGRPMWQRWIQAYLACVTFVDDQVGAVLDALESSGHAGDTIVIFTGDHGYHMGEKDYLFKWSMWEESARVPFVVRAPGVSKPGTVCEHPVSLIDFYPTLVDLCGLPREPNADGNQKPLDGHSLRTLLEDPAGGVWDGPSMALTAKAGPDKLEIDEPGPPDSQHYTLRSRRWRYIRCPDGEEELYDHTADPHEWKNLAGDARYAEVLAEHRQELFRRTGIG
jgi:arylsulfatase A-like enzyme